MKLNYLRRGQDYLEQSDCVLEEETAVHQFQEPDPQFCVPSQGANIFESSPPHSCGSAAPYKPIAKAYRISVGQGSSHRYVHTQREDA